MLGIGESGRENVRRNKLVETIIRASSSRQDCFEESTYLKARGEEQELIL